MADDAPVPAATSTVSFSDQGFGRAASSRASRLTSSAAATEIWAPIGIRLATMTTLALVVAALRVPGYGPFLSRFSLWDAQWYGNIAEHGYPSRISFGVPSSVIFGYPDQLAHLPRFARFAQLTLGVHTVLLSGRQYAFFPLYPALCWVVSHVTGLSATDAGLAISCVCSCALGPLMYRVAKNHGGSLRGRYLAVVLLGLLPMAVVFQMGYAEALFTALALAAFASAQQRQWWRAGTLVMLAGLTRPVGYAVAIGILAVGLVTWFRDDKRQRGELYRIVIATVVGAAGSPLMWAFTALQLHDLTAWFHIQKMGWGTSFDFGTSTYHFLAHQFTHPAWHSAAAVPAALFLLGSLAAVVVLAYRAVRSPGLIPYAVFGGFGWLTVALSSNYWNSKPRLLLLCFILVVPAACWLARQRRWIVVTLVGGMAASSLWYGAYMITRWPHAI